VELSKPRIDIFKVRRELKGKTMRLYLYLTKRSTGYTIDEIRLLGGFSNRALINQCLADMRRLGIVSKKGDKYYIPRLVREAVDHVFKHYAKIGSKLVPRGFLAAAGYVVFLTIYGLVVPQVLPLLPIGFAIAAVFLALGFYEVKKSRSWVKRLEKAESLD